MKKTIVIFSAIIIFSMLFVPVIVTEMLSKEKGMALIVENTDLENSESAFSDDEKTVRTCAPVTAAASDDLEEYIVGVVAAEMPALYEPEALKAQAVAARTYAQRKADNGSSIEELMQNGGQAYTALDSMKQKWGANFDKYYTRIRSAVYDTQGEIMVYNGEPILAVFHAISSGKTESAANIWQTDEPYLKSVDSAEDETSSQYETQVRIASDTAAAKLETAKPGLALSSGGLKAQMQVLERTPSGYIKNIQIGNMVFTGLEVRNILGLKSSDFTVKEEGTDLVFTTKGYGHGAGMSQYGANCLAKEGKNYKDILNHYYTGISFSNLDKQ